jgi:hypothetical protein
MLFRYTLLSTLSLTLALNLPVIASETRVLIL